MREVKMFGLQRSGTNYLEKLMIENYDVKIHTNKGGWKHGKYMKGKMIKAFGHEIDCLFISKNVYSWLWSAFKHWPNIGEGWISQFVGRGEGE